MIGRIPRRFLIVGIVTAVIGCDNVSWGGMSFSLEGPPGDTLAPPPRAPGSEAAASPQRIEYGPLLYAGIRQGDSALVVPVAEFVDGGLQPLPQGDSATQLAGQLLEERLFPGQELTLFHQGARIGTLTQLSAQWPPALQNIRQDLQLFQLSTGEAPSVVASFLFRDQMGVGPAPDESYSLLILGEARGTRFHRAFTWYRRVGDEGKGAPR